MRSNKPLVRLEPPGSLTPLFRPRSVAVIGASRKRGTIAAEVLHNLLSCEFAGVVYPVNPQTNVVQSVRAYPSIEAIPDEVDLAVIVVPAVHVVSAVAACERKGVRAVIVITAGFAEVGAEGRARQDAVTEIVKRSGMRLVGPNCFGVLNTDPSVSLNATFAPTFPRYGNVAFASQSGALGLAILEIARDLGIGISQFVSMGNRADVSGSDLIAHWASDPAVEVMLLYLENLGNPGNFMKVARQVSRDKPIIVVKSGRTEAGARAASSHTGSLVGLDVAVDALLGQAGILRTNTIDELFDVAMLLASQPVPKGRRVAILTNAGGPGIMATDALESQKLEVRQLSEALQRQLAAFLPNEASVKNPVDMIASATAEQYRRALEILIASDEVDSVLVLFVTPIVTEARDVAAAILSAAEHSRKTIVTCFMGRHGVPEAVSSLRAGHFPSYTFPESAAAALAKAVRYGEWLASPEGTIPVLDRVERDRVERLVPKEKPGPRWLDRDEVMEVLGAYGIATPRAIEVTSAEEARLRAAEIGFPLVMKLASDTIVHKSDVGGVIVGLDTEAEVAESFEIIRARLERLGRASEMRGVTLQAMVTGGVETFVGATRDPEFGHLLGFGIGGVQVELWKDVVFRVAPLRDVDARAMLDQIRGRALLDGFRGAPAVDRPALEGALMRISQLVTDFPRIIELDLNPLVALPSGAIAVDARIRVS